MKKKAFALTMAAVMAAASLAGCGSAGEETTAAETAAETTASGDEAEETTASEDEAEADETEAEAEGGEGGVLIMATNAEFEPWEYHEGDGIVGIDVEIAQAIADHLGMELQIEDMAFDAIIPSVVSGKADIGMAAISYDEDRAASVDFSENYASSSLVVLVAADSDIASADDLQGKLVGAQTGTTGELTASEMVGDSNVERYNSYFEAVQSLLTGKIDAVIIDGAPAKVFLTQNEGAIKQVGDALSEESYAIVTAKGNTELMDQISMVFQRVYLFQDTIYNNISMGKPDATEEEVYEAAKKARCYDFIMALPDGFQTVVGEGGATLSGGEKQRISIARCILKDAPIVILDEATASVDTDNESYIQEAISELVKGKTLLVIAHRLNTIQNADQILVIDNGQIAQHGTHEELLEQPGIYQDFVNIRKSAAGWSLA